MANQSGRRRASFSKSDICLEWTPEEQAILQRGLEKYGSYPVLTRYLAISNALPNKTTRDVACRARWMFEKLNGKRRKLEDNLTNKSKNEKGIDSSEKCQSDYDEILSKARGGPFSELLEQNENFLNEIRTNLANLKLPLPHVLPCATCQLSDTCHIGSLVPTNLTLFRQVEGNITQIMNGIRIDKFPVNEQMPPPSVKLDEHEVNSTVPKRMDLTLFHQVEDNTMKTMNDVDIYAFPVNEQMLPLPVKLNECEANSIVPRRMNICPSSSPTGEAMRGL